MGHVKRFSGAGPWVVFGGVAASAGLERLDYLRMRLRRKVLREGNVCAAFPSFVKKLSDNFLTIFCNFFVL
jgi:hypothetical protein